MLSEKFEILKGLAEPRENMRCVLLIQLYSSAEFQQHECFKRYGEHLPIINHGKKTNLSYQNSRIYSRRTNVKDLQAKHRSLLIAYGEEAQRYDVDKECRLWRETLDEASFIDTTCRPMVNQFDVEEIQFAADVIHLNVLVKDLGGIFI
nr:10627_t:CDS:2 [Entrophospora candida]